MKYTGLLSLAAKNRKPRTVVHGYYEGAFKYTRPVKLDEQSISVYLIHVGGGYVDGDTYFTDIQVEEGAELVVTSQASTKVYKTPIKPVEQYTMIRLAPGSVLEYCLDPLIMYDGARFIQETVVEMDEKSSLIFSEVITPGWSKDGQDFRYDWLRNKLKVYQGGKLVLYDHLYLNPDEDLGGVLQMEGYTHIGSFVLFHPNVNREWIDQMYGKIESEYSQIRFGISQIDGGGVVVRILSDRTQTIEKMIHDIHSLVREELLGKKKILWRK
ncbi:urease accessory protein UreD [Halobacillus mangrovi]|uniref:Urease accessory protein UreD n=1 Tax=Halobacillus mangrovi TaxID=402384 RepID=A0A1W5ZZL7_9BACI|nr:urease accessory protein UreD [Halobacillus mangrovi]ARI78700.1 urease accessory protein ureD [Halobacillus mangrovi]